MSDRAVSPKPTPTQSGLPVKTLLQIAAIVVLFATLALLGYRWMRTDALALLVQFAGQTDRDKRTEVEHWRSASIGDKFEAGDGAKTSADAEALFRLKNGARLKLRPQSQIRFQLQGPNGALGVHVDFGQAEVQTEAGAVVLASEFGELQIDAGSSVVLGRDGDRMSVAVELGSLQINNRRSAAGDKLLLDFGGIVLDPTPPAPSASAPPPPPPPASSQPETPEPPALVVGDGIGRADLVVGAGESFVVHDPDPPTAIGFRLDVCKGPARLVAGKSTTEAEGRANLAFPRGQTQYKVYCLDNPKQVAAEGSVRVLQDAGTQQLPTFTPTASVVTDGRRYTVLYQHRLPNVTVSWPTAPSAGSYTLSVDAKRIVTHSPNHTFAGLARGSHKITFSAATTPERQSRTTTVEVVYDTQAPAARVSDPPVGFQPGEQVTLSGQALPGWSVAIGDKPLEVDPQYRFSAEVSGSDTIPISFSHPVYGRHYYLRRPRATP
jgi:hypothetical protein